MQIAGLRVYDWQGEAKITFANGTFNSSAVADSEGIARLSLQAKPAEIAYTRPYHENESLIAGVFDSIIPAAHAESAAETACNAALAPISADAEDLLIRQAEQFMNMMLECFVHKKVEEARIRVETSNGLIEKTMAIVDQATFEASYQILNNMKTSVVVVANCLDAALTGNNASAVGAGCDFITSMLAIGDVRDLLIQSWNYHFDPDEFDALTASLSGVGLIASAAQLAGGVGVAPSAVVASGKTIAKFLNRVDDVGGMAGKTVGDFLGKIVRDPDLSMGAKINKFSALVPVFEITASVALIYNDNPRLFQLLAHMMKTPDKFERLSGWMQDYLARLSAELDITAFELQQKRLWLDYFINSAYAGLSTTVDTAFKAGLEGLLKHLDYKDISVVAMSFDEALEVFLDLYNDLGADGLNAAVREVKRDTTTIKALMNVGEVAGGVDNMRRFAQNSGWKLGLRKAFSIPDMVEAVANMRIDRLTRTPDELLGALDKEYADTVKKGLARVLSQVDHKLGIDITKGHMAQFLMVVDLLNSGKIIKGVEVDEAIIDLSNGTKLAARRIDIIIKTDGLDLIWEVKANAPDRWKVNLVDDMSMQVKKKADGSLSEEVAGQMLTDLGKLYHELKNDVPTSFRQRVYTPEALGLERKPKAKEIKDMEDEMNDKLVSMIEDEKYESRMLDVLGIDKNKYYEDDKVEVDKFKKAIKDLKQMVQGTYEKSKGLKMMKIYPFDDLVPPAG
jgi:hypothetical protein